MTNERYLIVSYFASAVLSAALGVAVYLFLRRPFGEVVNASPEGAVRSTLKRLFPVGLLFPALLGFVSVSYESCNRTTYEKIVEDRGYLTARNQEQLSSVMLWILVALFVWNLIIVLVVKSSHGAEKKSAASTG